ncbi:MAG: MBL fold metallo-hydrolase, partial [Actinobacteria bacterium]|nr:MBL fold metallo-hydrolase [Actinomycetota bacterium]
DRWFERRRIDDSITVLWEPHVIELMRCNIWHVRGRDRDLVVDTGFGVSSLVAELSDLLDRPVTAVATHGHDDHIGSHHEFADCVAHPLEAPLLEDPPLTSLSPLEAWGAEVLDALERAGYEMTSPYFVTALPPGLALEGFRQRPARVTRLVEEGAAIDTGDRHFEVLHLPGHSPGSIGLWEEATGTLFSGDAIYDGPLLDELPESNIGQYCATMERLLALPVHVVHAGHDPSFGRDRLRELARAYLDRRATARPPVSQADPGAARDR